MKDENVLYNLVEYLKANRIINRDIEIAEKTGYSRQIISNYISGRQKPSKQFMNKFIESYGLQSTETKIITPDKSDITSIRKGKTNGSLLVPYYEVDFYAGIQLSLKGL